MIGCMCVQSVFKAHEGAVHAMQLCQISSGSATPGPLCLVTSGDNDKTVCKVAMGQTCHTTAVVSIDKCQSCVFIAKYSGSNDG